MKSNTQKKLQEGRLQEYRQQRDELIKKKLTGWPDADHGHGVVHDISTSTNTSAHELEHEHEKSAEHPHYKLQNS